MHLDLPAPAWVLGLGVVGRDDVAAVGGKAANLGELIQAGLPVPPGFVVTTSAYRASVDASGHRDRILAAATPSPKDDFATAAATVGELFAAIDLPDDIVTAVTDAYCTLGSGAVAVRSSATAEDLAEASFAGQQDSYLNISGIKPLLEAVRRCWASLWTERALAYRARQGIDPADVSLAVVVQQLVDADASGVMFTADPATGQRDVVLISAAWGLGEAVVGGLVDPDQLTLTGHDPVVASRQTADKAVQTMRTATGTAETPVPTERRRTAVLHDESARALARLGRRIERHYHAPQDIEWVWLGDPTTASGEPMIVQSRPITALPEPTGPVPTAWPVPDPRAYYFRASIIEQLPDPLTPLFAELINPAVTSSISVVMAEVLGREILRTGDVGLPTINGYAYYAYSREGLIRLLKLTPAAMRRAFGKHGINPRRRWETTARPMYQRAVDDWTARDLTSLASPDLLVGVDELVLAAATYYTAVQTIIPIAATNEIVLSRFYDAFIRRDGDPAAAGLLVGFDSEPIRAERSLWDLARWVGEHHPDLAGWLTATPAADVVERLGLGGRDPGSAGRSAGGLDGSPRLGGVDDLVQRFADHLADYGHTVYNLDFANPVPADDPAPLVDTVRLYLSGQAGDPYARQRSLQHQRDAATLVIRRRIDPVRRNVFDSLLRKAQSIAPIREDALADVGLAWPQMRRMLRELGRRLVDVGSLDQGDDVYWCRRAEIEATLDERTQRPIDLRSTVAQRRTTWRGQRRAIPPQLLPVGTVMDRLGVLMPATTADQTGDVLTGIGASAGRVTGPARVLDDPTDFARLRPGDILVASITTPAWTSLFVRAGAVVTDIGGPLSHSSIVAREYGIPAVLGTGVATRRIVSGQQITVDGDAGKVYLTDPGSAVQTTEHRRLNRWLITGGSVTAAVVALVAVRRRHTRRPA